MDEQKPDEWLFEVEDVFNLTNMGLVIVCSLEKSGAVLRVGDELVFLCADGREIETQIQHIPLIRRSLHHLHLPRFVSIGLPTTPETLRIFSGDQAFRRAPSG